MSYEIGVEIMSVNHKKVETNKNSQKPISTADAIIAIGEVCDSIGVRYIDG